MKCWKCPHIGKIGKDLRGSICWCLHHNMVRDPNLGCNYQDVPMPERRAWWIVDANSPKARHKSATIQFAKRIINMRFAR